jgi:hypothetical protein
LIRSAWKGLNVPPIAMKTLAPSFAPARKVEILIEVDTPGILADLNIIARTSTAETGLSVAAYGFALELGARLFRPDATTSENEPIPKRGQNRQRSVI